MHNGLHSSLSLRIRKLYAKLLRCCIRATNATKLPNKYKATYFATTPFKHFYVLHNPFLEASANPCLKQSVPWSNCSYKGFRGRCSLYVRFWWKRRQKIPSNKWSIVWPGRLQFHCVHFLFNMSTCRRAKECDTVPGKQDMLSGGRFAFIVPLHQCVMLCEPLWLIGVS